MNVKSVTGPLIPAEIKKIERRAADASADREQPGQGDAGHEQKPKMTKDQLDQVMEQLRNLSGIRDNGLLVRLESGDGFAVVYIEDPTGKVIRRFPESDLWSMLQQKDRKTGHLFDKTG